MKRHILLLLYCIALIGIGINLFFDVKLFGIVGYVSLLVASIIQIAKMIGKK